MVTVLGVIGTTGGTQSMARGHCASSLICWSSCGARPQVDGIASNRKANEHWRCAPCAGLHHGQLHGPVHAGPGGDHARGVDAVPAAVRRPLIPSASQRRRRQRARPGPAPIPGNPRSPGGGFSRGSGRSFNRGRRRQPIAGPDRRAGADRRAGGDGAAAGRLRTPPCLRLSTLASAGDGHSAAIQPGGRPGPCRAGRPAGPA